MKKALFVQLPPPRFDFQDVGSNIPLAAGFLVSSLKTGSSKEVEVEILDSQVADVLCDSAIISSIVRKAPDVLAMTLYLWNSQRSLFIASAVKRVLPNLKVIVGGPEVSLDNEWVLRHPVVDLAVHGEGETQFSDALRMVCANLLDREHTNRSLSEYAPTIFVAEREDGKDWDLSRQPNPYIDGIIGPSLNGSIFLETVRGCPFRCRYCYYHKAFSSVRTYPLSLVKRNLDFAYAPENQVREIYLMDPTFNARPDFRDILKVMARLRKKNNIRVHTELRADLMLDGDIQLFMDAGLVSAEIGLQSVNIKALELAGRSGHPEKILRNAYELAKSGIDVTTGIILGLPGDDPEGFASTMKRLKETGAFSVIQPFTLAVLPGSDFRRDAEFLELEYDMRPPYYLQNSATFSAESMKNCLDSFEDTFDMELDHIGLPSLVEFGVQEEESPCSYVSKWIVHVDSIRESQDLSYILERATNPFTIWFKGDSAAESAKLIINLVSTFLDHNPHTVLHVVLEFNRQIPRAFLKSLSESTANPETYANKAFFPLYPEGSVISPNLIILLPLVETNYAIRRIKDYYGASATVVWKIEVTEITKTRKLDSPLLVSDRIPFNTANNMELEQDLKRLAGERLEEIMFQSYQTQNWWDCQVRGVAKESRLAEQILKT